MLKSVLRVVVKTLYQWFLTGGGRQEISRGSEPSHALQQEASNLNCSVGHMRAYDITRGPHYDADATMAAPKFTRNSFYMLFPVEGIMNNRKINYGHLYVHINQF